MVSGSLRSAALQHDLAERVDAGGKSGGHEGAGLVFDDDGGAWDCCAGCELRAGIDGSVCKLALDRVKQVAAALPCRWCHSYGIVSLGGQFAFGGEREGPRERLHLQARNGAAEQAGVGFLEEMLED